jgi:hypothetical protein
MSYTPDNWTDKELADLEKRIAKVYQDAAKDLDKEVKEYFAKFKLRDKEMQALEAAGEITQAELQRWRLTQMGRGQRFEALRDKMAERFTMANEVAYGYVNDATPSIYSLNLNYEAYQIEKTVGSCDFTLWDESTVKRLLVEQPDLMPYYPPSKALDRGIDLAYGKSQITKHITSGILRGLPPGKIANELMASVTTMSRESAVRAARTGITAAQNAGRMDSYVAAEKMGIKIKRRWICTKDSRTRTAHQGVKDVEGTKEPFDVDGEKMMFPGDTSLGASGWNIYNCRCSMRTVEKDGIEAEPRQMRVRDPVTGKNVLVNEMTYAEWQKWKETGKMPEPPKPAKPKKTAFTPAKTKQEAESFARQNGVKYADYSKLPIDTANTINRALETLPKDVRPVFVGDSSTLEKYWGGKLPRASKNYYGVTIDTFDGIHLGSGKGVDFDTHGQMVGISYSYRTAGKITEAKEAAQARYQAKHNGHTWFFNVSGETTPFHEMGHVYANAKGIPKGFEYAAMKWANDAKCDMISKPSEAWAEAWASYHTGVNIDKVPEYVLEFIRKAVR